MDNKELLEIWKRKLVELENKAEKLSSNKKALLNLIDEAKTNRNINLSILLKDLNLEEEVSYLDDRIEFHKENIPRLKNKIEKLRIEISQQEIEDKLLSQQLEDLEKETTGILEERRDKEKGQIKEKEYEKIPEAKIPSPEEIEEDAARAGIESGEAEKIRQQIRELFADRRELKEPLRLERIVEIIRKPFANIPERISNLERQKLLRYALPAVMLLLIVSVFFVAKPEITGYSVLTEKNTYEDNLNLIINESGNYTWAADKAGNIESIKASGRVKGNGTVKIYVEKDGERYLIYGNK